MITFKLKFLLAFSIKGKGKEKLKKGKKTTTEKHAGANKKPHVEAAEDPPYLIRLDKSFSAAHIEYELIPGKCKYQVDVLCWPNGAKIYTADGQKLFTTVTKNGWTFVAVCVVHRLKDISTDELILLQSSVIEFNVFTDKAKLGNAAKANKTDVMYIRETDCGNSGFLEASAEKIDTALSSVTSSNKTAKPSKKADDAGSQPSIFMRNEDFSQMYFEEGFADKLYEIIYVVTTEDVPEDLVKIKHFVKPFKLIDQEAKKTAEKKDAADGKKPKTEKSHTKLTLQVQGEVLFTDPNLAIFKVESHKCEVSKFVVVLRVEDLLTRTQKIYLNPIVLKIMHLDPFPVEVFENTGITDVYCKYSIPCIAECKTIEKPIKRRMFFNESHIYFTHTLSKMKLLEFLESKRLMIKIYGVKRYQPKDINPKLFGEKKSDADISKIHTNFRKACLRHEKYLKAQEELLAYCSSDLSSLLRNVWDCREKAQLHNMDRSTFIKNRNEISQEANDIDINLCDFWTTNRYSTNSINLANIVEMFNEESTSLLKEWRLLENTTSLNIEAYLLAPQAAALVLHQIPNTYKRLFLIFKERKVATEFFGKVLYHNQRIVCSKSKTDSYLTGWAFDNGNNIAIYVEGLAVGYILNLWQDLDIYTDEHLKVFFNTDEAYENRLYPMCNKISGFYIVTMFVPLDQVLSDHRLYVKGNAPLLCLKALTKLDLLFHTRTLKQMLQYDLFPTIDEFVSLDLEYGVPSAWKSQELSDIVSVTDSEIIQIEDLS